MEELLVEMALGLLVAYLAYRTGWRGELGWLHRYHYCNVTPDHKPVFARRMGQGLMAVGIGCMAIQPANLLLGGEIGYALGLALMAGGVVFCIGVLYRYNGSIFGMRKPK